MKEPDSVNSCPCGECRRGLHLKSEIHTRDRQPETVTPARGSHTARSAPRSDTARTTTQRRGWRGRGAQASSRRKLRHDSPLGRHPPHPRLSHPCWSLVSPRYLDGAGALCFLLSLSWDMDKIASPSELRQELSRLASYCHVPSPSRDKLASALRSLADNLSPRTATETRQSGHTIDVEAQLKKYSGLADGLYRDL